MPWPETVIALFDGGGSKKNLSGWAPRLTGLTGLDPESLLVWKVVGDADCQVDVGVNDVGLT